MLQLLLHGFGDYILQNEWMALNKTKNSLKGYLACFIHALTYSLPFLYITQNAYQWWFIFVTHFFIDKYRLAMYPIRLKNWEWKSDTGFNDNTPAYISFWLLIIIDNLIHLILNYVALTYIH